MTRLTVCGGSAGATSRLPKRSTTVAVQPVRAPGGCLRHPSRDTWPCLCVTLTGSTYVLLYGDGVPRTVLWILAAVAGVLLVAGVTAAASSLSSQSVGLSSEPLSAGEQLTPRAAAAPTPTPKARKQPKRTPTPRRRRYRLRRRPRPPPSTTTAAATTTPQGRRRQRQLRSRRRRGQRLKRSTRARRRRTILRRCWSTPRGPHPSLSPTAVLPVAPLRWPLLTVLCLIVCEVHGRWSATSAGRLAVLRDRVLAAARPERRRASRLPQ